MSEGAVEPFFTSRWITVPEHVSERASGGLPQGFRAAGVACGIKPSGKTDLGLLVSDAPETTSAVRFTRSGVLAAPVLLMKNRCQLDRLRVMVANSGNANAATGNRGLDEAARCQGAGAMVSSVPETQVGVASTGVIGVQLPGSKIVSGLLKARSELSDSGDVAFADAIRTTDLFAKRASLDVELPSGTVTLSAQAKGAGMISPSHATMFCFVQTDAALTPATCDLLLGVCVRRSFDCCTVDGQLSTNDTVVLMASGASGVAVAPGSPDEARLGEALDALLRQLALMLIRDGEGAKRIARITVTGGDDLQAARVARAIANSPLVKTALYGGDPNWGRIAQATGLALLDQAPVALDVTIEGIAVCRGGTAIPHDTEALVAAVARPEVEYAVGIGQGGGAAEVYFSDLGYEYVRINAEYTT